MMKVVISFLLFIMLSSLAAQDSIFVRLYNPSPQTNANWEYYDRNDIAAANVFEDYQGNFVLQTQCTWWTPSQEDFCYQSPMIIYSRNGIYLNTSFGPVDEDGYMISAYYKSIIPDGQDGFLALTDLPRLVRLSGELNLEQVVTLMLPNNAGLTPVEILPVEDGFLTIGTANYYGAICAKYDYDMNRLWMYNMSGQYGSIWNHKVISTSDGGFLFSWQVQTGFACLKVNAEGDSLWCVTVPAQTVHSIVETNNHYYGFYYHTQTTVNGVVKVFDYGINFNAPNPNVPVLTMDTQQGLFWDDETMYARRTMDGGIVMAVSSATAEVFKFDSNLQLQWTANALSGDRIGYGKHPLIELANGDLVYCARTTSDGYDTDRLALVRINSQGQFVGVEENIGQVPQTPSVVVYPNPFNPNTSIFFDLPKTGLTQVTIYNAKGQLVKQLGAENRCKGGNQVFWNGKDNKGATCTSGVYFVKISCGKETATKKLMLIK